MFLDEFSAMSLNHAIGLLGFAVFVGIHILLNSRKISGDGLAYFAGNTVAAALVLASNFGGVQPGWVLIQIALIALALLAMIARFFDASAEG